MESELDKMIKEKEHTEKTSKVPLEAVPLAVIPIAQPSTASTVDGAEQLTKAVQNMSIQEEGIKKLQDQVKFLQYQKSTNESSHAVEARRAKKLIERFQKEQKESAIRNTLGQVKEIIWADIMESLNGIWPSIHIIFEQKELIQKENEVIATIKA